MNTRGGHRAVANVISGLNGIGEGSRSAGPPDYVDEIELAARLGIPLWRLRRLLKLGVPPEPQTRIGTLDLWEWTTVSAWIHNPGGVLQTQAASSKHAELVDIREIARRLRVRPRVIQGWCDANKFPPPDYHWTIEDAWLWSTVETWRRRRGLRLSKLSPLP